MVDWIVLYGASGLESSVPATVNGIARSARINKGSISKAWKALRISSVVVGGPNEGSLHLNCDHGSWKWGEPGGVKLPHIPVVRQKDTIPYALKWAVWERDDFRCQQCGTRKELSVDHIKPELHGGKLEMSNLQTLCRKCNSSKGSRV